LLAGNNNGGGNGLGGTVSRAVKSNEKLMDRFIPYRLGENL